MTQGLQQVSALGAVVSDGAGLASAVNVEANNRELHPTERQWITDDAPDCAKRKGISLEQSQQN